MMRNEELGQRLLTSLDSIDPMDGQAKSYQGNAKFKRLCKVDYLALLCSSIHFPGLVYGLGFRALGVSV